MTADRQPLSPVTERPFPEGAFDAPVLEGVAELLASVWDPGGALLEAASQSTDPSQPDAPQRYAGYAQIVCGMLAAGGNLAQISQYLRLEEERLLGTARSSGKERWSVAWGAGELMGKPFPQHPA